MRRKRFNSKVSIPQRTRDTRITKEEHTKEKGMNMPQRTQRRDEKKWIIPKGDAVEND